jgi:hypothetical protein
LERIGPLRLIRSKLWAFTQRTSPAPFPKGAMFGAGFRFGIKDALAFRPGSFTIGNWCGELPVALIVRRG